MVKLKNNHLGLLDVDHFHHLGFSTGNKDLEGTFKDVKFVCLSGSVSRVKIFAEFLNNKLKVCEDEELVNLCQTDRYVMYKVGPILVANHGMGVPSTSILLNELFKLLHYAGATDVVFFRLGTCGGLGLHPGTVVLTRRAVNGLFQPKFTQIVLGKEDSFDTEFNHTLSDELLEVAKDDTTNLHFDVVVGDTMCCDDFYEGQGRLDGAFCSYSKSDKEDYLMKAYNCGIRNIEMESLVFASMCNRAGVKAGIVCVVLVNRLDKDQVVITKEEKRDLEQRPALLVLEYIRRSLKLDI